MKSPFSTANQKAAPGKQVRPLSYDAILKKAKHLILKKVDAFVDVLGVKLPLLGAGQAVVDRGLALRRGVGVHQAAAQQYFGAAKRRKIGKVNVLAPRHTRPAAAGRMTRAVTVRPG